MCSNRLASYCGVSGASSEPLLVSSLHAGWLLAVAFLCIAGPTTAQAVFQPVPDGEKKDGNEQVAVEQDGVFADTLEKGELFEGDLKLTVDQVRQVYDLNSIPIPSTGTSTCTSPPPDTQARDRRNGDGLTLWPEGIIHYSFDPSISVSLARVIRYAMNKWEEATCLHFVAKDAKQADGYSANCVNFTAIAGDGCYSDSIGMKGGSQVVNLGSSECHAQGAIMHLLGHVVGFWHEQSRPDRDNFVLIMADNIDEGRRQDFMKRKGSGEEYASSGLLYDYASIMHFDTALFSKCENCSNMCPTLVARNPKRYEEQGSPVIGQREKLSAGDIQKTQVFYYSSEDWECPPSLKKGRLLVHVDDGINLPYTGDTPDGYVKVIAKAMNLINGHVVDTIESTTTTSHNQYHPTWDESLDMGGREWMPFFRIELWDKDYDHDDPISVSEEIMIDKTHMERIHCIDPECHGYVQYVYNFTEDGDECLPNPCMNGGVCTDEISAYTCTCQPGWTGADCHISLACYSTPCKNGATCNEITDYDAGTSTYTCSCPSDWIGRNCDRRLACYSGPCQNGGTCTNRVTNFYAGISTYTCSCSPFWVGTNCQYRCPCLNGGSCVQPATVTDYRCLCPYGWIGTNCETRRARLQFYVRYGVGLPDEDGWFNDSDPYVKIVAYDHEGNSVTKTSSVDGGDESPEWYQWIDFGTDTWVHFYIRVYDDDWGSDDDLSSWELVTINPGSFTQRTHNCHSGYIKYDYFFN